MENEIDIMVGTALVDMYAKFGTVDTALKVFEQMHRRNEATWNALHGGLAMHGRGKLVLNMFPQMLEEAKPDELTFIALLSACSHSGLFDQGRHYFYNLQALHGATPQIEHCACMVDLLGRAGNWKRLKVHGKLELGESLLQELVQMEPHNTDYHDKANLLRQDFRYKGLRKLPGISSVYIGGQVHQLSAGDMSHPNTMESYMKLDEMIQRLRRINGQTQEKRLQENEKRRSKWFLKLA
ncbi:hypothetical protein FF1_045082 [Malus domestica]